MQQVTAREIKQVPELPRQTKTQNWWWLIAIALYVGLNLVFISPEGNFPLDDDWVYAHGVKSLLEHGRIEMPTSFSTAFVHVGIGALACKVFGFSYTTLHWSTAVLGIVAILALYLSLRELGIGRNIAGFSTLLFASNPLIVHVFFSFLSDLPSLAFTNLYVLFFLRGIKRNSLGNYALASLMLSLAAGSRQGSLLFVVPNLAVIALSVAKQGLSRKPLFLVLLLVVLPLVWTAGLESMLENGDSKCIEYTNFKQSHVRFFADALRTPLNWLFSMMVALGQISCYFGLYCLPLLVLFVPKSFRFAKQGWSFLPVWFACAATVVVAALTKLVVADKRSMPFSMNMLRIPEVGAHNLMGVSFPALNRTSRMWLTHISGMLASLFLLVLATGLERCVLLVKRLFAGNVDGNGYRHIRASIIVFVFAATIVSLGCVAMETVILDLDRHYMIAFAPAIIALAVCARWWRISSTNMLSVWLLIFIAGFSTLATQDYLSWNRARWRAIAALEAKGVDPYVIDGGPEYVFPRDPELALSLWRGWGAKSIRDTWRWWRVRDDQYIISFSPVPGYKEIGRQNYFSGMAFGERAVLILKRIAPDKPLVSSAAKTSRL